MKKINKYKLSDFQDGRECSVWLPSGALFLKVEWANESCDEIIVHALVDQAHISSRMQFSVISEGGYYNDPPSYDKVLFVGTLENDGTWYVFGRAT